jgi:hypothetical protein
MMEKAWANVGQLPANAGGSLANLVSRTGHRSLGVTDHVKDLGWNNPGRKPDRSNRSYAATFLLAVFALSRAKT